MAGRSHTNIEFKMKCLMTAERSHSPLYQRSYNQDGGGLDPEQ